MKKKQTISIIIFIIGIISLVIGGIFLGKRLGSRPSIEDGEYLVSVGEFKKEDEPEVIWNFTEIGKGRLTTNNHLNDYDFLWALEGAKMKIETEWLTTLENEYKYRIDGEDLILITEDSTEVKFSPASSVDTEITENN